MGRAVGARRKGVRGEMRAVGLFIVLLAFWLLMSGHYSPFLIGSGIVCCLFVVLVWHRGRFDLRGGSPIHPLLTGAITYWPWILWQIVVANWDVTKRVWHPKLPIDPQLVRIPYDTETELLTTLYANSITLTPGTVTVSVDAGEFEVHALTPESAEALHTGAMQRRVKRLERAPSAIGGGGGAA